MANWVPIGCQSDLNRTPIVVRSCPNWGTIWYQQWAKWHFQSSITHQQGILSNQTQYKPFLSIYTLYVCSKVWLERMPCRWVMDDWKSKISRKIVQNCVFKSYYLFHHILLKKTLDCNQIDLGVYYIIVNDSVLWRGVCEEISQPEVSPWSILKIVCQLGYNWLPIGTQLAPNWPRFTTNWVNRRGGHI